MPCIFWKLLVFLDTRCRRLPTRKGFVYRLATLKYTGATWKAVNILPVKLVLDTNGYLGESIKNVQLYQA